MNNKGRGGEGKKKEKSNRKRERRGGEGYGVFVKCQLMPVVIQIYKDTTFISPISTIR